MPLKSATHHWGDTKSVKSEPTITRSGRVNTIKIGENEISVEAALKIIRAVEGSRQTRSDVLSVSREMVRAGDESTFMESPQQRELGAIALAISPQAVFSDAGPSDIHSAE